MTAGIRIAKLTKTYSAAADEAKPQPALDLEDIFIPFGKTVAVLGRSGCGKSTLLNVLGLIINPDRENHFHAKGNEPPVTYSFPFAIQGKNQWDIGELWDDPARRNEVLREHFGFVFQDSYLFPGLNVNHNIQLPLLLNSVSTGACQARWSQALESGLFHEFDDLKDDKHARGEVTPDRYSGGQLQRFALFRSMLHEPFMVFADEPTGNLDPQSARLAFKYFKTWQRQDPTSQRTLLLVTHDVSLAREFADYIMIINSAHKIYPEAIFEAKHDQPQRWTADKDKMTDLMGQQDDDDNGTPASFNLPADAELQKQKRPSQYRFAWVFSQWDFWPKTPRLLWTTIAGLVITTFLALLSFLILGFYKGAENYLNFVQSNPFIRSVNIWRPLVEELLNKATLAEIARIAASPDSAGRFYLPSETGKDSSTVLRYVSGFNRQSFWAYVKNADNETSEPVRLKGRTIDPCDPIMKTVADNWLCGQKTLDDRDFGVILSERAVGKLGLSTDPEILQTHWPKFIFSNHGSGIEERERSYPVLGIAKALPEPGGDLLITNYFYAQIVNHYFDPSQVSFFEAGYVADAEANQILNALASQLEAFGLWGDFYTGNDGKYVLKFSYQDGVKKPEDEVSAQADSLLAILKRQDLGQGLEFLPFHREERSVAVEDTSLFTYGALYLKDFRHIKKLRRFLERKYNVDMELGVVESLDTINTMRQIIAGIVLVLLASIGLTGFFVVYSVFNQFANRSSRQFGVLKTMGIDGCSLRLIHGFELLILFGIANVIGIAVSTALGAAIDQKLRNLVAATDKFNEPFFQVSILSITLLAALMFIVYTVASFLAVRKIHASSAIELMKDQKEHRYKEKSL